MRGKHQHGFGELGSRWRQAVELSALLELIEPTHRGDDMLPATAFFPAIFHDLQITTYDEKFRSAVEDESNHLRNTLAV